MTRKTDTPLKRKQALTGAEIENDLVLMDIEQNKFFGMNEVGRTIWKLLETPITENQLVEKLLTHYDIEPDACRQDVTQFLDHLQKSGLLDG